MHRFYIAPEFWNPATLKLDAEESHHCANVLRAKVGDHIEVFNGQGAAATAEIVSLQKNCVEMKTLADTHSSRPKCEITLGLAIPKGKTMDLVMQKATELGAAEIVPLLAERTVVQTPDINEAAKKREKWRGIVIEAAKQCGQNWLPEVAPLQSPQEFFREEHRYDFMLIASLQPDARSLKSALAEHFETFAKPPKRALVLIGPEGDFTAEEIELAKENGCHPITLGTIVLRVETAAFYCLSVLNHELLN